MNGVLSVRLDDETVDVCRRQIAACAEAAAAWRAHMAASAQGDWSAFAAYRRAVRRAVVLTRLSDEAQAAEARRVIAGASVEQLGLFE